MFAPYIFDRQPRNARQELPHDPPHKAFCFSSRPIWILLPIWGLIIALAVVSTPRRAQAAEEVQAPVAQQQNCAQTKSDSKIFNKNSDDPRAIEERKKCYSSHFKGKAKPEPKAVKGERVMQPEYGANSQESPQSNEAASRVQNKQPKPEPAGATDMYLKIGDIKGESKD